MAESKDRRLTSRFLVLGLFAFCLAVFSNSAAQRFFSFGTSYTSLVGQPTPVPQQNAARPGREDEPTPIEEGVMTEKQEKHSKIFKGYRDSTGGKRLKDLILNQNEVRVEVPIGDVLAPRGTDLSEYLAAYLKKEVCNSDAIVVGTVTRKSSQLVDDGTFTFTDYEVNPDEVLRNNSKAPVQTGNSITLTRPGGSVNLKGHVIRARDRSYDLLSVGHRYLLFLQFVSETGAYQPIYNSVLEDSFELDNGQMIQVSQKALPFGNSQPRNADSFLGEVRKAVATVCN